MVVCTTEGRITPGLEDIEMNILVSDSCRTLTTGTGGYLVKLVTRLPLTSYTAIELCCGGIDEGLESSMG